MSLMSVCLFVCLLNTAFTEQTNLRLELPDISCYTPTSIIQPGITCNCTRLAVNCSHRGLTSVPHENFEASITSLDLHGNFLSDLTDYAFTKYVNLTFLDLSQNSIQVLQTLCFQGLNKLMYLNLTTNRLQMYQGTFPPNVFQPLNSLDTLHLNNNSQNVTDPAMDYPDQALSVLSSLKCLYLDGLQNKTLGSGFRNMTSLRRLILSGYLGVCQMRSLTKNTFMNVPYLYYLDISNCSLSEKYVHNETFAVLKNLSSLNISNNEDIGIEAFGNIMYGLYNTSSLRELSMRLVVNQYSMGVCLASSHVKYFPRHLQIIDAQENNFIAYSSKMIERLSRDLTYLDLSGNRFIFGQYLESLKNLTALKHLILSGSNFVYNLPSNFPNAHSQTLMQASANSCEFSGRERHDRQAFSFPLPPNLEILEMNKADLQYRLTKLTFSENKLKKLSLANNTFPSLIGPIYGLDELQFVDLSFNYIEYISDTFFNTLSTLQYLNLSNNLLGSFLSALDSPKVFSALGSLQVLDLSFNLIVDFKCDLFSNLTSLEQLFLGKTSLIRFNVDISRMSNLTFLNFRRTRMKGLDAHVRQSIDRLIANKRNISIDMSESPIRCECKNYDFMMWMTSSKAFNKGFKEYLCVYTDDSGRQIIDGYNEDMSLLNHQCISNVLLLSMIAIGMVLIVGAVGGGIVYKYRWKIRYLYNAAYLQIKSSKRSVTEAFDYDAFISYDQEDSDFVRQTLVPELEKRGLTLCIHASDFIAGEYISSNIVKAVNSSRRTVVVLTRNLLSSYWCNFEIQMANMEALHTGRRVLIFLLVDNISNKDLGVELLYYIRSNTYIPFPEDFRDSSGMTWLWNKVASDIRDE